MQAIRGIVTVAVLTTLCVSVATASRPAAECSTAQKTAAAAAVKTFQLTVAAQRRAYFKSHRRAADRAAFVKRQNERLRQLRAKAACTVGVTPPPNGAESFAPQLATAAFANDRGPDSPDYGEWPIDHTYFLRATRMHAVMLFVDFPDSLGSSGPSPQTLFDTWAPKTIQWFKDASYGRFDYSVDALPHWLHMSGTVDSYALNGGTAAATKSFVDEALTLADPEVDFSKVDLVYVIGANGLPTRQFRPWPGGELTRDGVKIAHVVVAGDPFYNGGTRYDPIHDKIFDDWFTANLNITHETLHNMGLPDHIKKTPDGGSIWDYVGGWDLMDSPAGVIHGADIFAWDKYRLGWIDPDQLRGLTGPGTIEATISPVETAGGVKAVFVPVSATKLYGVEVRRHLGQDARGNCDEGVLVYTVDSTGRNGDGPISVFPAKPSPDPQRILTCGLKYAAPFNIGPGQVSTFEDENVKVELLATDGVSVQVRVTRK